MDRMTWEPAQSGMIEIAWTDEYYRFRRFYNGENFHTVETRTVVEETYAADDDDCRIESGRVQQIEVAGEVVDTPTEVQEYAARAWQAHLRGEDPAVMAAEAEEARRRQNEARLMAEHRRWLERARRGRGAALALHPQVYSISPTKTC